jgi:autotransporter adhesin
MAHATGIRSRSIGVVSYAEGIDTTSSGEASHAEGSNTNASGKSSHAEGKATTTLGEATHAEGMGTIANGMCQHAQGRYNIEDTGNNYLHIVGNGENEGNRSNAHTIDWGGNGWFAGKVTADDIVIEGEIGSLLTYVRELETRISALES